MENYPTVADTVVQVHPDRSSDRKSRFWQIDYQPNPNSGVICPKPRRSTRVPNFINALNQTGPKAMGILPMYKVDCAPGSDDLILGQDDPDNDSDLSNQVGFFYGSPPVRTNNPIINDVEFIREAKSLASLGTLLV